MTEKINQRDKIESPETDGYILDFDKGSRTTGHLHERRQKEGEGGVEKESFIN